MPTRRTFLGLSSGIAVTLAVTQRGQTAHGATGPGGWNVPLTGSGPSTPSLSPTATVQIRVERCPLTCAPEGINFEVIDWQGFQTTGPAPGKTLDPRKHDLVYFWDFGDPDTVYQHPVNLPAAFMNRNVGYGWRVSHTYRQPGTPTVSVLVVEPATGIHAVATVHFDGSDQPPVADPATVFGGRDTIWLDNTGDTTGMPLGASAVTTLEAAENLIRARTSPTRLVLRSGQVFEKTAGGMLPAWPTVWFCASDPAGPRPVINHTGSDTAWEMAKGDIDGTRVLKFSHIEMRGQNDPTTEKKLSKWGVFINAMSSGGVMYEAGPRFLQVDDCRFGKFGLSLYPSAARPIEAVVHDTTLFDHYDFGIFGSFTSLSVNGVHFQQDPEALSGGPKGNMRNEHVGGMRVERADRTVIDACDFFCHGGWDSRDVTLQNHALRFNSNSTPNTFLNMRRCVLEGGFASIQLGNANEGVATQAQNYVVGECVIVGSWSSSASVMVDCGGVTIENCLMITPDFPGSPDAQPYMGAVHCRNIAASSAGTDERVVARHNTIMVLSGADDYTGGNHVDPAVLSQPQRLAGATQYGNILHVPRGKTPATPFAPMTRTQFGTARENGYRVSWTRISHKLTAPVPNGGSFTLPYPPGKSAADFGSFPSQIVGGPLNGLSGSKWTVSYGDSEITITNLSGSTLTTGTAMLIYLDHREGGIIPPRDTGKRNPPDAMSIWRPAPGSPAIAAAGPAAPLIDLLGTLRPGTQHPQAPAGRAALGAVEPA